MSVVGGGNGYAGLDRYVKGADIDIGEKVCSSINAK